MDADSDRIPALHLTLDHYLPLAGGDWVRVTGLELDGPDVIIATGPGSGLRVPGSRLVFARLGLAPRSAPTDSSQAGPADGAGDAPDDRDVERRMAGWYAGDLRAVQTVMHGLPARR